MTPGEAIVLPFPEEGAFARSLTTATEEALVQTDAIIALYSPEAARGWSVNVALHRASRAGKPGCLLMFPGVDPPAWATDEVVILPLEGFKDSGPALPPGTDERQILQASRFAGETLSALLTFVRAARAHERPALPEIPFPPVPGLAARLGV